MEWIDKWHLEYPDHSRTGGFSFASAFLDENDLDKVMQDKHVVDCEERVFGNYEGVYLKYHDLAEDGSFNDGNYLEADKISACVDSVQVADDLQLLDQNRIPEEWKTTVGADGKIINNTLSYIKSGDGVNTLDKIVKTESVKQKLVYASVTYANKTDKEINHMPYLGSLMLMNHEDGMYRIYVPEEQSGNDYDSIIWDGAAKTAEMTYMSVTEDYGNGDNYISSLNPGESIQVNMAWISGYSSVEFRCVAGQIACDDPVNQAGHMFRRVLLATGQPGLDESDAAVEAEGIKVIHIMGISGKLAEEIGQYGFSHQLFDLSHKDHISVGPHKSHTEFFVLIQDGQQFDGEFQRRSSGVMGGEMSLYRFLNFVHQFIFDTFQHLINVCVMKVEGGAIDIDFLYQFFYGNFFDAFFLHQCGQSGTKLRPCFTDAAICFF